MGRCARSWALVEDQIVPEAGHGPGTHASQLAEAALGAKAGVLGNELEGFLCRVEQPVGCRGVVARDVAPMTFKVEPGARFDQIIHLRREPFLCSP
jgi:hypothetical protein